MYQAMENLFFEWKAVLSYRSGRTLAHGRRVYNSISFSGDKIDQLCTNSKHHFQLIFRSQDLNIAEISSNRIFLSDITDKTDDIDLSSKATGCALAKVSIKNSNDCLRYPKEQIRNLKEKLKSLQSN